MSLKKKIPLGNHGWGKIDEIGKEREKKMLLGQNIFDFEQKSYGQINLLIFLYIERGKRS